MRGMPWHPYGSGSGRVRKRPRFLGDWGMIGHGIGIVEAAQAQMRLPAHLRTEHWYNDWQHAVFIITFDHLMRSIRRHRPQVTQRLMDKLTVYLFVHFLCEEEGMSWAVRANMLRPDLMRRHQDVHVKVLNHWHDAVQKPYKAGALDGRALAAKVQDFYDRVLAHIDEMDQHTYGDQSQREEAGRLEEVAHLAECGLPLSPNMPGAVALVGACHPEAHRLLDHRGLPLMSTQRLRSLRLTTLAVDASSDSLHARLTRAAGVIQSEKPRLLAAA